MLQRKPKQAVVITNMYFTFLYSSYFNQVTEWLELEGTLKHQLVHSPATEPGCSKTSLLKVPSNLISDNLRDRAATFSLGNLCRASASL